jgi:hypothetical protein
MKSTCEKFINWCVGVYLVLYLAGKLIRVYVDFTWAIPSGNVAFAPTTWLINYAGGFVRRGLQGEVLYRLHDLLAIEPQYCIAIISIVIFAFLVAYFITRFIKRGCCWWIVPLTFFMGGFEIDRTDGLALMLMLGAIASYRYANRQMLRWILLNIFGVCSILVHEISFLLLVPMSFALTFNKNRSWRTSFLWLSPMMIAFAGVVCFSGNVETVSGIRDAWRQTLGPYWDNSTFAGISSLGWTIECVMRDWCNCYLSSRSLGVPDLVWFASSICFVYVLAVNSLSFMRLRLPDVARQQTIGGILLFQLFMILPMAVVFFDTSRFIGYWIASSFLWFLTIPETGFSQGLPRQILTCSKVLNALIEMILAKVFKKRAAYALLIVMMCLGIPPVGMNLIHAGGRSIMGTYITFAFAPVFVDNGLLANPAENRPYCEVFAR